MKNHLVLLCAGVIASTALGMEAACAAQSNKGQVGSKTTAETRGAGSSTLATNTSTALSTQDLNPVAMSTLVTSAPNSPQITAALIQAAKTDEDLLKTFGGKLEHDITYRDAMVVSVLADEELVDLFLSKYAQSFPKLCATLSAGKSAQAQ